ncbi:uncharacterized protein G2W53_042545 [Senna tora]|uniref:Uncharacterized protein n=1 Tax=Senna tora TaxID=362788 RepID=A0A834W405_9FABA|nr:uncharacterized protein G2W53_042545 [Senna tora]
MNRVFAYEAENFMVEKKCQAEESSDLDCYIQKSFQEVWKSFFYVYTQMLELRVLADFVFLAPATAADSLVLAKVKLVPASAYP